MLFICNFCKWVFQWMPNKPLFFLPLYMWALNGILTIVDWLNIKQVLQQNCACNWWGKWWKYAQNEISI